MCQRTIIKWKYLGWLFGIFYLEMAWWNTLIIWYIYDLFCVRISPDCIFFDKHNFQLHSFSKNAFFWEWKKNILNLLRFLGMFWWFNRMTLLKNHKKKYPISIIKETSHKIEEITIFCGQFYSRKHEFRCGMYPGNFQKLQMSPFLRPLPS